MQDFKPYIVVEETGSLLYLKEAKWRKNAYFFIFRILPFFFLLEAALAVFFTYNVSEVPKAALILIPLVTCIPAAILFTRKYVTDIELTPIAIVLTRSSSTRSEQHAFPIADIDHILYRKKRGKGGGYFYYLVLKAGRRREMLMRFSLFGTTGGKIESINTILKKVTSLEVVNS